MTQKNGGLSCAAGCWLAAAIGGLIFAVLLWWAAGFSFLGGFLLGLLAFAVAGFALSWALCSPTPTVVPPAAPTRGATRQGAASPADAGAAAAIHGATPAAGAAASATVDEPVIHEGARPPGEDGLDPVDRGEVPAEEKVTSAGGTEAEPAPASGSGMTAGGATARSGRGTEAQTEVPGANSLSSGAAGSSDIGGPGHAEASSTEKPRIEPAAAGGGTAGSTISGTAAGKKPEGLSAPREGGADDLTRIKGIGPKLAVMLNEMGYYHFDQIANWSDEEVAWVDGNLQGFRGRVSRDEWVRQARELR